MKPLHFVGSSREELRELPEDVKETAGHQLFKVQQGKEPEAVYVLHVFEKRSQKTAKSDIQLAKNRYADLLKWRKEQHL